MPLLLVSTVAVTQGLMVVIAILAEAPNPTAALVTLGLLNTLAFVGAMLARIHAAPMLAARTAAVGAAATLGIALGAWRADALFVPSRWQTADSATISAFLERLDVERMILASPCIESSDGTENPLDCNGPHQLTVARAAWDDRPLVVGTMIRVEVDLRDRRQPDNPTSLPPRPPHGGHRWGKAIGPVETATDRAAPWHRTLAADIRDRFVFDTLSGARATALYTALILGDRSDLPPSTRHAYQDTGTAHLLAISGFNLALFGFGLFRIVLWLCAHAPFLRHHPAPSRLAAAAAIAVTALYTLVAVPSDATDRALVAIVLTLGISAIGLRTRGLRTLNLCLLTALILDPSALLRAGFQLSFVATLALIVAVPLVGKTTAVLRTSRHLPNPWVRKAAIGLVGLIICDIATHAATLPIGLVWFGQSSPHAIWVNLIAIPWMSLVVFPAGLIHLFLAWCCPPLADLLAPVVTTIGVAFETFIIQAGQMIGPQHVATWPWWLGWPMALVVLATLTRITARRLAWLAALVLAAPLVPGLTRDGALHIDVLDVGHGDAIAIRHPDAGTMLIDTGGVFDDEGSRALAERVLIPALAALGIERIDVLVITHADRDHIGAAPALAERIPIAAVWLPPCAVDHPSALALGRAVTKRGGRIVPVAADQRTRWGDVELGVLWPPADSRRWDGRCRLDSNDASLVMRLAWGPHSLLLTGDIEAPAEAALLARHGNFLKSSVLKVPHHGSRSSSTDAFLAAVDPALALVSGLPGRHPMPPHDDVLARYTTLGIPTHITGRDGAIRVSWHADGTQRVALRRPPENDEPQQAGADCGSFGTPTCLAKVRSP